MKALSIRQPWAYCISHLTKRVENRTWGTSYRGPILIHAAKAMEYDTYQHVAFFCEYHYPEIVPPGTPEISLPAANTIPRGGIVARAKVIDCIRSKGALPFGKSRAWGDTHIVPWWQGPYGIVLDEVEPVPFVPCNGRLSLFDVDASVMEALAA